MTKNKFIRPKTSESLLSNSSRAKSSTTPKEYVDIEEFLRKSNEIIIDDDGGGPSFDNNFLLNEISNKETSSDIDSDDEEQKISSKNLDVFYSFHQFEEELINAAKLDDIGRVQFYDGANVVVDNGQKETLQIDNDDEEYDITKEYFSDEDPELELPKPQYNILEEGELPDYVMNEKQFNIRNDIKKAVDKIKSFGLPNDDDARLFKGNITSVLSKGEFARELRFIVDKFQIPRSFEKIIMLLIDKCFPNSWQLNLPLRKKYRKQNVRYYSTIDDYVEPVDLGLLKYDVCSSGCMPFVGDKEHLLQCEYCKKDRFHPCNQCFNAKKDNCIHNIKKRTSYSYLQYQSLTTLFINLIKLPGFIPATQYRNKDIPYNKETGKINDYNFLRDNMNTQGYQMATANLERYKKQYFDNVHLTNPEFLTDCEYTYVPLYLSVFYDGAQIHKSKVSSFNPLVITINNLPPSFRNKFQVGTFLASLFTCVPGSAVERFMFNDCLIRELNSLLVGKMYLIDGKYYFLQAILYKHIVDTVALEDYTKTRVIHSNAGCCFCGKLNGCWRHDLHKNVYVGHRHFLPYNHLLRSFGQSKLCCPEHYYTDSTIFEPLNESLEKVVPKQAKHLSGREKTNLMLSICSEDAKVTAEACMNGTEEYIFFHENIDQNVLKKLFYFHHIDYREFTRCVRVDDHSYQYKGRHNIDGVFGIWPFYLYPPAKFEFDIGYEPMHALKNIVTNLEKNMSGERFTAKIAAFCKKIRTHPSLYEHGRTEKDAANIITGKDRKKIDAWLNAIIIPKGYRQELQVQNLFRRSSYMRTDSWMKWAINLIDFTMSGIGEYYPEEYKIFHSMLSSDLKDLFSPVIDKSQLEDLYNLILETICTHEGAFPESECNITWHQFMCIVPHMHHFGPLVLFWAFGGERSVGLLKQYLPRGGGGLDKIVFSRYLRSQKVISSLAYDFTLKNFETVASDHSIFSNVKRNYTVENGDLMYSDETFSLNKCMNVSPKCKIAFSEEEVNDLIETICTNVKKRCSTICKCCKMSSLFRLYWYFENIPIKSRNEKYHNHFTRWAKEILATYNVKLTDPFSYMENMNFSVLFNDDVEDSVAELVLSDRIINSNDIKLLSYIVNDGIQYRSFAEATIFGMRFKSRGWNCKEQTKNPEIVDYRWGSDDRSNDRHWPDKHVNELKHHWKNSDHYSCWGKIRVPMQHDLCGTEDYNNYNNYIYVQFNQFLQLYFPFDNFINNLSVASVTCRRHVTQNNVDYIVADNDGDSFLAHKMFVALNDVYSTPVLMVAFKSSYKENDNIYIQRKQQIDEARSNEYHDKVVAEGDTMDEATNKHKRKRNIAEKHNVGRNSIGRELFVSRINRLVSTMRRNNPVPFFIGDNRLNADLFRYAPADQWTTISYLVMLELYGNRRKVRYEAEKDEQYRETIFSEELSTFRITYEQ
jgi:hypothetical protein